MPHYSTDPLGARHSSGAIIPLIRKDARHNKSIDGRDREMTFERLYSSKGALRDTELDHLLRLALKDPAILDAARQLAENARAIHTKQGEQDENLSDNLWQEIRSFSLSGYAHSNPEDWEELYRHVARYSAQRWLPDLER